MKIFKILSCLIVAGIICISTSGCLFFHNPLKMFTKENNKVTALVGQVNTNSAEINSDLSGFVFSADATLRQNPSPDKYNLVARDFTSSALKVTGTPTPSERIVYENTISNLLSDNKKLQENGQKVVEQENRDVAGLLSQRDYLNNKLQEANVKLEKIGIQNGTLAKDWIMVKRIFWGIIILIGFVFVVKIISCCVPPPYSSISFLVSIPISWFCALLHNLFPEIKDLIGLVDKGYKAATSDLVNAINALKTATPEQHATISATVAANVNDASIPAINSVKTANKLVS